MSCKNYEKAKAVKMSFKEKTNIDNITFAQLDDLVNDWIYETGELHCRFINQSDELKCVTNQVALDDVKCMAINNNLNRLKCMHNYVEYVLRTCQEYHEKFERMVLAIECKILDLYRDTIPKDKTRSNMYETAEKIDEALQNNQRLNDRLTVHLIKTDRASTKDPTELIVRIMMRQLHNLEMSEVKIQQMFNNACVVNSQLAQLKLEISRAILN